MKSNDARILEMKKEIEVKRSEIAKVKRFAPVTNCKLRLEGKEYSIHTLSFSEAIGLLMKINSMICRAKEIDKEMNMDVYENYKVSGYTLSNWKHDVVGRLEYAMIVDKKAKLKVLERKLDNLLTSEKKTELEIDIIENALNF